VCVGVCDTMIHRPVTAPSAPSTNPVSVLAPTRKHPKWRNLTSDRESGDRFSIGKFAFLFELPSNYRSISLSFGDSACGTHRRTDNTDHYYRWDPHFGGPANNPDCRLTDISASCLERLVPSSST